MNAFRHPVRAALSAAGLAAFLAPAPALAACPECGTVIDVKTVQQEGQGSGTGAVLGGVVGGVLGHQVGSGRGNTVATIAGAGAGAYAGHQIEKNRNAKTVYRVIVKMEGGNDRTFNFSQPTSWHAGDAVKIVNGKLTRP